MRKATATTALALGLALGVSACSHAATKGSVKGKILHETRNLNPAVTDQQAQCIVDKMWETYDSSAIQSLSAGDHTFTTDELAKIAEISKGCVTSK